MLYNASRIICDNPQRRLLRESGLLRHAGGAIQERFYSHGEVAMLEGFPLLAILGTVLWLQPERHKAAHMRADRRERDWYRRGSAI